MSEDTIPYTLLSSIKDADGKTVTSLMFREPELGDAIDAEEEGGSDTFQTAFVLARMCGLTLAEFRKVKPRDFHAIIRKTADWLGNAEQDGEDSPS